MDQTLEQQLSAIPEAALGEQLFGVGSCLFMIGFPFWHGLKVVIFGI
mgnify:CR=1 FL=1